MLAGGWTVASDGEKFVGAGAAILVLYLVLRGQAPESTRGSSIPDNRSARTVCQLDNIGRGAACDGFSEEPGTAHLYTGEAAPQGSNNGQATPQDQATVTFNDAKWSKNAFNAFLAKWQFVNLPLEVRVEENGSLGIVANPNASIPQTLQAAQDVLLQELMSGTLSDDQAAEYRTAVGHLDVLQAWAAGGSASVSTPAAGTTQQQSAPPVSVDVSGITTLGEAVSAFSAQGWTLPDFETGMNDNNMSVFMWRLEQDEARNFEGYSPTDRAIAQRFLAIARERGMRAVRRRRGLQATSTPPNRARVVVPVR